MMASRALAVALCLLVSFALQGCIGFGRLQPASPVAVDAGRAAGLISGFRAERALSPVRVDSRLIRVAGAQALAMAERDKMGHFVAGSLSRRVSNAGYDWGVTAENLGRLYPNLDTAVAAWKASTGHRANLLNPGVTDMGIAAAVSGSGHVYWALVLAAPRPPRELQTAGPFGITLTR
jgi:uncharacterized protein YkwD